MNELNLNAMGVTEMNNRQMKEVDGGIIGWIAAGFILGGVAWGIVNFIKDVIVNREDFDMTRW